MATNTGDTWQSEILFLTIFDLLSSIVLTFSIAAYRVWTCDTDIIDRHDVTTVSKIPYFMIKTPMLLSGVLISGHCVFSGVISLFKWIRVWIEKV